MRYEGRYIPPLQVECSISRMGMSIPPLQPGYDSNGSNAARSSV
ncbi:hypothetical protein [Chitinophaga costaii]|nr:hypothetical protein [Chitinophaga costaii]